MLDLGELSCIKCHEVFNTTDRIPRLLAECGHTLCSLCISSLIKSDNSNSNGFKCPDDGILCGALKKAAEEFPKNLSLLRILEKQQQKQINESANSKEKIPENQCAVHKRKLEIVCIDCKIKLCSKCALFEGHRTHDLRTEEDVQSELNARKECLQEMLQMVAENEQIFTKQEEVKNAYEKCMAREKEIHTLIELRFQEYFDALKAKKAKVIQSLANVALALGEKFTKLRDNPKGLSEKVGKWKVEYFLAVLIMKIEQMIK